MCTRIEKPKNAHTGKRRKMRVCLTVQGEWRKIELTFVYGAHHLASDRLNRRAAWRGGCRIWLLVPREPLMERVERKTKKFMKQEAVRTPSGRRSSLFSERKVIYLAERKVNRIVKPALLGDAPAKRQDQPLSRAADDAAFVGKISDPLPSGSPWLLLPACCVCCSL